MDRALIRLAVRSYYDYQGMRIRLGQRLKVRKDGTAMVGAERVEITDADLEIFTRMRELTGKMEGEIKKYIRRVVSREPLWREFLKGVKGVGPVLTGVILSEYDIEVATTVSKLWAFTGLVPGMRLEKGKKAPYNRFLKAKMLGVMAECLLRANSPYRDYYDAYKHRKESEGWGKERGKGTKEGHRHRAACRYMVKMLLKDLYVQWRTLEGLPVRRPYAEEYLGRAHGERTAGPGETEGEDE